MTRLVLSGLVIMFAYCGVAERAFAADERKGREVYDVNCASCHGENGISLDPLVPNFADGDMLFMMDAELLKRIGDGNDTMPGFRGLLSTEEMRDVVAYIRTF